jgi:hypothetical protein
VDYKHSIKRKGEEISTQLDYIVAYDHILVMSNVNETRHTSSNIIPRFFNLSNLSTMWLQKLFFSSNVNQTFNISTEAA